MNWWPVLLLALGGFLSGGVVSTWKNDARPLSAILALAAVAAIAGGVLWLI